MIKHYMGLPLQIIGALVGLFIYLIIGSYMQWITPIWWGGKADIIIYFGSISVLIASLVYYFLFLSILKFAGRVNNISYLVLLASGILLGFIFLPSLHFLLLFKQLIPIGQDINPFLSIAIVLILMGIVSIALTMTIFFSLISIRRRCANRQEA